MLHEISAVVPPCADKKRYLGQGVGERNIDIYCRKKRKIVKEQIGGHEVHN